MANDGWNLSYTEDDDGADTVVGTIKENLRLLSVDFSGATEPPVKHQYMRWLDETAGVLKQWDGSAWVVLAGRLLARALSQTPLPGAVSATRQVPLVLARPRLVVSALKLYHLTATTSDGSNHWTIDMRRDSDNASMFSAVPTTNGNDFVAKTIKTLTPNQNTTVTSQGVSLLLTAVGTPPTLTDLLAVLEGYEANP